MFQTITKAEIIIDVASDSVGGCVLNKRWIEDYFSVHVASTMCQLQSYGVNTVY